METDQLKRADYTPTWEEVRTAFDYDPQGFLTWREPKKGRTVGTRAGCLLSNGYRQICFRCRKYTEHRLVWLWHHGQIPEFLDHIDRNPSNNRIDNLRPATQSQNCGNLTTTKGTRKTASKWRGVVWCKRSKRWKAMLQCKSRVSNPWLGTFKCEADAALAYNFAACEYFGEFAVLNLAEQTGIPQ